MILGDVQGEDVVATMICDQVGAVVTSVEYRLAYGGSAGGGLTIATALLARDRGFPALRFQMPIYPRIDPADLGAPHRRAAPR